jgi:hypothetical protein
MPHPCIIPHIVRGEVLCHLSPHQLDHLLRPDALAVVRSKRYDERSARTLEVVIALLNDYALARAEAAHPQSEWLFYSSATEAVELLHLHEKVKRVAGDYCQSVASKMCQENEQQHQQLNLSQIEQLRLHRGIYRFQMYCNFFGAAESWTREKFNGRSSDHIPKIRFLASFPPWEVQEIAGIWQHLSRRWVSILREVSDIFIPKHISHGGLDDDSELKDTFDYVRRTRHRSPEPQPPDAP